MAKNQFKTSSKSSRKSTGKKTKKRKNPFKRISSFFSNLFANEKLAKSVGLSILVFSAFLLLAFSSFIFTWKVDQNIINNHWNNPNIQVENWMGKLVAYFAHQFIFNGFGVASFIFIFLFFIIGFRVLFKIKLLPIDKCFKYSIFSIVWISIFSSYFFSSIPILGGAFGFQSNYG